MTLFVEDLFTYLSAAGTSAEDRVYPVTLPQQPVLPAVTYLKVSGPRDYTHSGLSALQHPRFQFDCWSLDYLAAHALAEEILRAVKVWAGSQQGGISVQSSFVEDDGRDNHDPDTGRHWVSVDVIIFYKK